MARHSRRAGAWLVLAALGGCLAAAAGQESACVRAAAGLAPCLAANTPLSALTAAEEATCCEALAAFDRAGCFCAAELAGAVRHEYWKRARALAVAHEQCGSARVSCPSGSQILALDDPPAQLLLKRGAASLLRRPQLAGPEANAAAQQLVQLLSREGEQQLALALAARSADLAALLREGRELEVEVSLEMTVQPQRGAAQEWAAWVWEPLLLACALLALLAGVLAAVGCGRQLPAGPQQQLAGASGVVLAAEEARRQPLPCRCACSA